MRIAVDAAGGDYAPEQPVRGAVMAARQLGCTIILLGPEAQIQAELAKHRTEGLDLVIVDAPEVINMEEAPVQAVRRKPRSAHAVGLRMVRDGAADAFVSAGHSGATMAAATLILGRIRGVERPALATIFPTRQRTILILDVGATTDCKPEYLVQFAQMGSVYAERALGIKNPRVALLANGEEETKGDRLVQEAHVMLRGSSLNFVGNAEPKDALLGGSCDVLVCDGLLGNLLIKQADAIVKLATGLMIDEVRQGWLQRLLPGLLPTILLMLFGRGGLRIGALLGMLVALPLLLVIMLVPPLRRMRRKADYRSYGGAPLLGLKEVAIVAHGKSDAAAVMNAIRQAKEAVERGTVTGIADLIAQAVACAPEEVRSEGEGVRG